MITYKRFVSFTASLSLVLAVGALNALFMTPNTVWYSELVKPYVDPELHSALWLLFYLCTAIIISEFFINDNLRRYLWSVAIITVGSPLWCMLFFRLYSAMGGLILATGLVADLVFVTVVTAKRTRCLWIPSLILTLWYLCLAGLNLVIVVLN